MEEINNQDCNNCKCSKILKTWWVKSLLGFLIFLIIFWLGVLFGQNRTGHCPRFNNQSNTPRQEQREPGRKARMDNERQAVSPIDNINKDKETPVNPATSTQQQSQK